MLFVGERLLFHDNALYERKAFIFMIMPFVGERLLFRDNALYVEKAFISW